jgi:hypothetical protein
MLKQRKNLTCRAGETFLEDAVDNLNSRAHDASLERGERRRDGAGSGLAATPM